MPLSIQPFTICEVGSEPFLPKGMYQTPFILEFLDRVRTDAAGGTGASAGFAEVGLVVVIAFNHVVVEGRRHAAEAQQSEGSTAGHAGNEESELVGAAAIDSLLDRQDMAYAHLASLVFELGVVQNGTAENSPSRRRSEMSLFGAVGVDRLEAIPERGTPTVLLEGSVPQQFLYPPEAIVTDCTAVTAVASSLDRSGVDYLRALLNGPQPPDVCRLALINRGITETDLLQPLHLLFGMQSNIRTVSGRRIERDQRDFKRDGGRPNSAVWP
jgi:hypothetical protein